MYDKLISHDWHIIANNLGTTTGTRNFQITGHKEYLIVFKTTTDSLVSLVLPAILESGNILLKYYSDSGWQTLVYDSSNYTWTSSNNSFYGVLFARD